MNDLPIKTYSDILVGNPYHDPPENLSEDWEGCALDILKMDNAHPEDRVRIVLKEGWLPSSVIEEFVNWCANEARIPRATINAHATADLTDMAHCAAFLAANYFADMAADQAAYIGEPAYEAAEKGYTTARERQVAVLIRLLGSAK